jgi:hypothetical protein
MEAVVKAFLGVLLCLAAPWANAQTNIEDSQFQISIGASLGSIVSGQQRQFVLGALNPTPDGVDYFGGQLDVRTYITKFIGTEACLDFLGMDSASYGEYANNEVDALQVSVFSAGLLFRFPPSIADSHPFDVYLGGGANFNIMSYSDGFNAHYSDTFQGGVGYYAKGGGTIFFYNQFFFSAEVEYQLLSDRKSGASFDGNYFAVNGRFGMAL